MAETAIVVLGSPNDKAGNLSCIAIERCKQALSEYHQTPGAKILPTGGWGEHFNTTEKPHAYYIHRYLVAHGIPDRDILECVESASTIEDAKLSKPILDPSGITELIVVTSDFHIPRARFLFEREFPEIKIRFSGAKTHLAENELSKLEEHEKRALQKLKQDQ